MPAEEVGLPGSGIRNARNLVRLGLIRDRGRQRAARVENRLKSAGSSKTMGSNVFSVLLN